MGVSWQAAQHVGEKLAQGPQGLSGPAGCSPVSKAGSCLFSHLLAQHSPQQRSAGTGPPFSKNL